MYNIVYLPIAKRDISEIAYYISNVLSSPKAAHEIIIKFEESIKRLELFPYSCKIYTPVKNLKHEMRKLYVENYIVFYSVLESEKNVIVHRILYNKMDINKHID